MNNDPVTMPEFTADDFVEPLQEIQRRLQAGEELSLHEAARILNVPFSVLVASIIEFEMGSNPNCEVIFGIPIGPGPGERIN